MFLYKENSFSYIYMICHITINKLNRLYDLCFCEYIYLKKKGGENMRKINTNDYSDFQQNLCSGCDSGAVACM